MVENLVDSWVDSSEGPTDVTWVEQMGALMDTWSEVR